MQGLKPELVRRLLAGGLKQKPAQDRRFALVRTKDGIERVDLKNLEVGGFAGKTGSAKRSRKGRTYKAANGSRFFAPNWENEVIAYQSNK